MNVAGVGLATTISQVLSAAMIIINLRRRTDCCRLELRKMKLHREQLSRILRIGFPAGIQGSLFAVSNVIIQSSVNSFGAIVVSGNAAAGNIEGFVYTTMNSFHQTAMNFTGQNYGAGKYDRIKKISIICLASVFVAGLTAGCTAYLFGRQLLSFYIPDSEEAIRYGLIRISYICLPYFLCGLMDVTTGLIRGLGSSMLPMIITVIGVCGMRIGWIYTVFRSETYPSVQSLYISYAISWSLTFITELIVFFVLFKKIKNRKNTLPAIDTGTNM
jgi:Na+-driven multidrug efflux pump